MTSVDKVLTDAQNAQIANGSVRLHVNHDGRYVAVRTIDKHVGTGRSPRQAIEAIK